MTNIFLNFDGTIADLDKGFAYLLVKKHPDSGPTLSVGVLRTDGELWNHNFTVPCQQKFVPQLAALAAHMEAAQIHDAAHTLNPDLWEELDISDLSKEEEISEPKPEADPFDGFIF